jgi:hypothetical protein
LTRQILPSLSAELAGTGLLLRLSDEKDENWWRQ